MQALKEMCLVSAMNTPLKRVGRWRTECRGFLAARCPAPFLLHAIFTWSRK